MKKHFSFLLLVLCASLITSCALDSGKAKSKVNTNDPSNLFLMSNGPGTSKIKAAFLEFIAGNPSSFSVAVVDNATKGEANKMKKFNKTRISFHQLGFDTTKIIKLDLLKNEPEELRTFDMIYFLGGNPFKLLAELKYSKSHLVLKELAGQGKIMVGDSAGAMIFGPNLEQMQAVNDVLGFNHIGLLDLSCLGLCDFHIFPHYNDLSKNVKGLETDLEKYEKQSRYKLYKLNDDQAIAYKNGQVTVIGD